MGVAALLPAFTKLQKNQEQTYEKAFAWTRPSRLAHCQIFIALFKLAESILRLRQRTWSCRQSSRSCIWARQV